MSRYRATMLVNDEEVDVELRPAPEAAPAAEAEEPEQLSLLAPPPERSPEDLLIERVLQKGPLTEVKKSRLSLCPDSPHRFGLCYFPKTVIWI